MISFTGPIVSTTFLSGFPLHTLMPLAPGTVILTGHLLQEEALPIWAARDGTCLVTHIRPQFRLMTLSMPTTAQHHHSASLTRTMWHSTFLTATARRYYYLANSTGWPSGLELNETHIQAGQGFFVLAMNDNSEFQFTRAMQEHSTGTAMLKSSGGTKTAGRDCSLR